MFFLTVREIVKCVCYHIKQVTKILKNTISEIS